MQFVPKKDDQPRHQNCDSAAPTTISYVANIGGTWGTTRPIPTAANGPAYGTLATFLPRTTAVRTPVVKTPEAPSARPTDNYVNATKLLNTLVAMNSRNASNTSDGLTNFERGRTTLLHCGETVPAFSTNHAISRSSASYTSKKTSLRSSAPLQATKSTMRTRLATTNDEVVVVVDDDREADDVRSSTSSGSFVFGVLRSNLTATDV